MKIQNTQLNENEIYPKKNQEHILQRNQEINTIMFVFNFFQEQGYTLLLFERIERY